MGYLYRSTAVYGSGKFGLADRSTIETYEEFFAPFQVELLAVFLLRNVVFDLVDYFAKIKGGSRAVTLSNELKKVIGIEPVMASIEEAKDRFRKVQRPKPETYFLRGDLYVSNLYHLFFISVKDDCRH